MEVAGVGNILTTKNFTEAPTNKAGGFHQLLTKAVCGKSSNLSEDNLLQTNNETQSIQDLLSYLENNNLQQLTGGKTAVLDSHQGLLTAIKDLLGISDEKWSEILDGLQKNANKKKDNGLDDIEMFIAGFSGLNVSQLLSNPNEDAVLFLKAAKLYHLLSDQNTPNQQYLTGLLDSVQDQLETLLQTGKSNSKLQYLQNTFSQVLKDVRTNAGSTQTDEIKTAGRLTGDNGTFPVFQHMSRPEQLTVMLAGTQKSVSPNDLISQFESILAKSQFSKGDGIQKLSIKLFPENLGSLRIELIQKGELIAARILTTTDAAKHALESHLHTLRHAFESQNIKVETIEINQQQSGFQQERSNRNHQNQQQEKQEPKQEEFLSDEADTGFTLTLEEALTNQE